MITMYRFKAALGIVFFITILLINQQFSYYVVHGDSMMNTYHEGQLVFVDKWADPSNFDVIVSHFQDTFIIKRVIGIPGDCVTIRHNHLYLNGKLIDEKYVTLDHSMDDMEIEVPEENYFVMGDNRDVSLDSRDFGTIDRSMIVGVSLQ